MQHPAIAVVKYIPDVFVEDNKTNDVQLVYSGFNCCIVTVSGDDHWIQIVQPRMSTKVRNRSFDSRRLSPNRELFNITIGFG
jgi:hypothetical protein